MPRQAHFQYWQSSERGSCRLCGSHFDITIRIVWIHEKSDDAGLRHEIMQQLQSLGDRCRTKYSDTGSITTRPAEAVHQAFSYRVSKHAEHYRNSLSGCLRNLWRRIAPTRDNYSDCVPDRLLAQAIDHS